MAEIDDLTDEQFGHWLAGFVDGEGCFTIIKHGGESSSYWTCLSVIQRDDDLPLLTSIHRRTGLGRLTRFRTPTRSNPNGKPTMQWAVKTKEDCAALVRLFDRYPLMSRKRRDYEIWKRAVAVHATKRHPGMNNRWRQDWSDLAALKAELEAARVYRAPAEDSLPFAVPVA